MTPEVYRSFCKEASKGSFIRGAAKRVAQGVESVGGGLINTVGEGAAIARDSISPFHMREGLRKGWRAGSATGDRGREILRTRMEGGNRARRKLVYVDDFTRGQGGIASVLRRHGILRNAPKYIGDSKVLRARNMLARATPGMQGTNLGMSAVTSGSALLESQDANTGRQIGWGERIGKAGLGMTGSVVGLRGGFLSSVIGETAAYSAGGAIGRGIDNATGFIRGTAGRAAAPQATGVK